MEDSTLLPNRAGDYERRLLVAQQRREPRSRGPVVEGFETTRVTAYWLTCMRCGETELFYGSTLKAEADAWAANHKCDAEGDPS